MHTYFDNIRGYYNSIADGYANEWYRNNSLFNILSTFASLFNGSPRILDVGCGAGYHSATLKALGAEITGIDISERAIEIARKKNPHCSFEVLDFRSISEDLGLYDGIISIATFMHIPHSDLPEILRRIRAVLKSGGYLLTVINEGSGKAQDDFHSEVDGAQYSFINYYYTAEEINSMARKEGLRFVREPALPREHAQRNYKCYLYQAE